MAVGDTENTSEGYLSFDSLGYEGSGEHWKTSSSRGRACVDDVAPVEL